MVYAVRVADINADGRLDIVAINPSQLAWFENPSWQRHVVVDGGAATRQRHHRRRMTSTATAASRSRWARAGIPATPPRAASCFWRPAREPGGTAPWTLEALGAEPTLHRIRWATIDGSARLDRDAAARPRHRASRLGRRGRARLRADAAGWRARRTGRPRRSTTRATSFTTSSSPTSTGEAATSSSRPAARGWPLLTRGPGGAWSRRLLAEGAPGEVALGRVGGRRVFGTIEPWHGTVRRQLCGRARTTGRARSLDDAVTGGHAVAWADFDGDGDDELVAGWRDGAFGLARYRVGSDGGSCEVAR